jgi:uracil-DNA glycosylase
MTALAAHREDVLACTRCPQMVGPVVTGKPVISKVYLIGQAPGPREGQFGKPFAWTAGKMLFRWFTSIGINEEQFRSLCFMAAVCRCFPGKTKQGGDRVPSREEIEQCSGWMKREVELLKPELVIPVGRLAIEQVLEPAPLADTIGKSFRVKLFGHECDIIPLPHPSGASTWFKKEPGKTLLAEALSLLKTHPSWQEILKQV